MQEDKEFESRDKTLIIRTYHDDKPDIIIVGNYRDISFEFESKQQLEEIIEYLNAVKERWS